MPSKNNLDPNHMVGQTKIPTIAFVGTPNCGKTTLFNAITGLRQKIGNFPGVTVDSAIALVTVGEKKYRMVDLPGTYSLSPKSPDEKLTADALAEPNSQLKPDFVVFVLDASNPEKCLFLFAQVAELNIPTLISATMIDEVKASGGVFHDIELERKTGVQVFGVVGTKGLGVNELISAIGSEISFQVPLLSPKPNSTATEDVVQWSRQSVGDILRRSESKAPTKKIDQIALHPVAGPLIFAFIMIAFFQSIFTVAEPIMNGLELLIAFAQTHVNTQLTAGLLQDFLSQGVLAGIGSVIVFVPQIAILFLFITILEDSGYLARAAFLVDRSMGLFGLQGRSFVPLLGSFACAIPGILSARSIPSPRDRLATMLIAPLMTCSARLPVYTLLIGAFFPAGVLFGFLSIRAAVLLGLYLTAIVSGLLVALLLKKTLLSGSTMPFLIEFPPYRLPSLRNVSITVWLRVMDFLKTAGTTILVLSVLMWGLSRIPVSDLNNPNPTREQQLEHSALGVMGKAFQPFFSPCGFDWKLTVGILASFTAREVFVSVMAQLYSADARNSESSLRSILSKNITFASALSVLAFYVYALQCMSTIAVLRRETRSWKWPLFAFAYTFALAYSSSVIVYYIAR